MEFNLKNLALLGGNFKKCKEQIFKNDMELFKKHKLKTHHRQVTNKKQALAIALNQTQLKCLDKMSEEEITKLINKVNNDLDDTKKELLLSNLIETKNAIIILNDMKKSKKAYYFKKLLWDKIIDSHRKGLQLDKNMWNIIKEIHNL